MLESIFSLFNRRSDVRDAEVDKQRDVALSVPARQHENVVTQQPVSLPLSHTMSPFRKKSTMRCPDPKFPWSGCTTFIRLFTMFDIQSLITICRFLGRNESNEHRGAAAGSSKRRGQWW